MAVIKCVPPVPGLSTRAIGFTYESHALLFRRLFILDSIHPPSLLYRTNLSKFHCPSSVPCRKIWNTFRNGEKKNINSKIWRNSRPPPSICNALSRDVSAVVARRQQPWWDKGGVEWPAGKIVKQRCREILAVSIKRGAVIERKDVAERVA